MQAAKDDIPDYDNFEWEVYRQEYPGIPLKHLLDNYARHGRVEHNADCPTASHEAFMNEMNWPRLNNAVDRYDPEVCPAFPKSWNQWHDEVSIAKLKNLPLKTFF